jgi:hypothetical protein
MPLNYDHSAIPAAVKFRHGTTDLSAVTQSLIFATNTIGIRTITEANAGDFFARLRMMEWMHGAYLHDEHGQPKFISAADVRAHIGLETNAGTHTPARFNKLYVEEARRSLEGMYTRLPEPVTTPSE